MICRSLVEWSRDTPFEMRQQTMTEKIVQLNDKVIKVQLKELVRGGVEETPQRAAGGRGRETALGCPVLAQWTALGLPQRPL